MSPFNEALKSSKLFSLPPRSVARRLRSADVPKYQTLETTSASAHRRDWGLKFPVTDARTKEVEFCEFEDEFSTNGTRRFTDFAARVRNLDHLAVPLTLLRNQRMDSLFGRIGESATSPSGATTTTKSQRPPRPLRSLRPKEYRELLRAAARPHAAPETGALLSNGPEPARPVQWESSAIGASYAAPGVLFNFPKGVFDHKTVKGRDFHGRGPQSVALLGGFVASQHRGQAGVSFEQTYAMGVPSISNDRDGALLLGAFTESTETVADVLDSSVNV